MTKQQYIDVLTDVERLDQLSISELEAVIEQYPYFQSAHLLLAKKRVLQGGNIPDDALGKTATFAGDRNVLFNYLYKSNKRKTEITPIVETSKSVSVNIAENTEEIVPVIEEQTVREKVTDAVIENKGIINNDVLQDTGVHIIQDEGIREIEEKEENIIPPEERIPADVEALFADLPETFHTKKQEVLMNTEEIDEDAKKSILSELDTKNMEGNLNKTDNISPPETKGIFTTEQIDEEARRKVLAEMGLEDVDEKLEEVVNSPETKGIFTTEQIDEEARRKVLAEMGLEDVDEKLEEVVNSPETEGIFTTEQIDEEARRKVLAEMGLEDVDEKLEEVVNSPETKGIFTTEQIDEEARRKVLAEMGLEDVELESEEDLSLVMETRKENSAAGDLYGEEKSGRMTTNQINEEARKIVMEELGEIKEIVPEDEEDVLIEPVVSQTSDELRYANSKNEETSVGEMVLKDMEQELQQMEKEAQLQKKIDDDIDRSLDTDKDLLKKLKAKVKQYKKEEHKPESEGINLPGTEDEELKKFVEQNKKQMESNEAGADIEKQVAESIQNTENILSETMAKVYAKQGLTEEAIKIYHKLSLKYPEKRRFFAEKIDELSKN